MALAVLAPLAAFATSVHADMTVVQALTTVTPTATGLTISFSNLSLAGFDFVRPGALANALYGTLTSVSINATLDASVNYTYADDLTVYVDLLPLSMGGLLQLGGFSNLSASETHSWANGGSSEPGTTVIDAITLTTPITFNGAAGNPVIWIGNGYGDPDAEGTWSGSITLDGLSITPVPEPSSWVLLAAGGLGLVGWIGRRRRNDDAQR